MGFLQNIQKELQDLLATQQRAALMQILRQHAGTMTFEDLRQFISSPVGKGFASTRLSEVFGGPTAEVTASPEASTPATKPAAVKRKRKAAKQKRVPAAAAGAQKKDSGRAKRKAKRTAKKVAPKTSGSTEGAATPSIEKRSPPGVSPAKRAEMERYELAVLAAVREAGDWVAAGDVRPRVGGNAESLRLALKRLTERKTILRQGERSQTRYKIVD